MVVGSLINSSLRTLGVLANGEVPSAQESNDAFDAFTLMLDSLSTESLIVYSILREVFPLTANKQTYTWGIGGDFNSARPQKIERAAVQAYGTNPVAELPMTILNMDQYSSIIVKTVTSSIPQFIYNDNANPLANINFWPVTNVGINAVFYSWKTLASFANLQTAITLPPGYLRMLKYNLAVELAPEYGIEPSETVLGLAIQSKKKVKNMNSVPVYMQTDAAIAGKRGAFNWLTGDTV